jgi:hypothetical protein
MAWHPADAARLSAERPLKKQEANFLGSVLPFMSIILEPVPSVRNRLLRIF